MNNVSKKTSLSSPLYPKSRKRSWHWLWEQDSPQFPTTPGVYYFLSAANEVLYVGKAVNLKRRLQTYRKLRQEDPKTNLLLKTAAKLKFIKLASDFAAILAEANLIRTHQPKFNLRLKDDKSPLYIQFSEEEFPRVLLVRKTDLVESVPGNYFGPFSSASETRNLLKLLRPLFPFCNANQTQKQKHQACFYSHLNLCPGACTGKISAPLYRRNIRNLKLILSGQNTRLEKKFKREMIEASKKLDFEKAAQYRDCLTSLIRLFQTAHLGPNLVSGRENQNLLEARIELWQVLYPFLESQGDQVPKAPFSRIEAYDVSNLQGTNATGSLVVFTDGYPNKQEYRKFRIRGPNLPDDPRMLAETLTRRFNHHEWYSPDLIVVDGGKAQLMAARHALAARGLHHRIPIIGLTKQDEEIVTLKSSRYHFLRLNRRSTALQLLQRLRDEAHRFAKQYHTKLRSQALII